ncbi:FtsX-like permease family protein [Ferrimonas lipolytica]|uniref:ABC3 transporter permease C-terminal domain-containing protein n=1 Tax=Ferrimonas lipolytica TaxID=2724191 RepID=A0A6H1UD96_9GAMM|nr:FtsX-like permease family protein [Ferrimonas lipolytica]QIZ76599.1 hypothetical protein HER31_06800 [Ferrimonas lipolytica]
MSSMWLRLLLGEWRQHALLYLWLVVGLVLAAGLLSGVEVLNRAAKSSFSQAEGSGDQQPSYRLYSLNPGYQIPHSFWLKLRLKGIEAQPVLIGRIKLADLTWLPLRGLSLPTVDGRPHWQTLVSPQTASRLGWSNDTVASDHTGQMLPRSQVVAGLGSWLWMDLAPAARLLGSEDKVSFLDIASLTSTQHQWLTAQLDDDWRLALQSDKAQQQQPLLSAFSMNLTALAVLSFLVGLLLAYHALSSLVRHRQYRYQVLTQLGVAPKQLATATAVELMLLSLVTGVGGSVVGVTIAQWLSPGVELTLTALYQADSVFEIHWRWQYGLYCCLLMVLTLSLLLAAKLAPWHKLQSFGRWLLLPLVTAVIWLTLYAATQAQALILSGLTLLLAMAAIPLLLAKSIGLLANYTSRLPVNLNWALADLKQSRVSLTMALVAISLALATAIATRILTGSFAIALDQHLSQRLFAVAYIRAPTEQLEMWLPKLEQLDGITDVKSLSQREGEVVGRATNIKVVSSKQVPVDTFHFKQADEHWWLAAANGACLINEPMALQQGLTVGQQIEVSSGHAQFSCNVAGIYYDYGNPNWEITVERSFAITEMRSLPLLGLGLKTESMSYSDSLAQQLESDLGIPAAAVFWQQDVLATAQSLFKRTFAITDALAWLTLGVALISWLASLMAQRKLWSPTNDLLSTLGMTPAQLFGARIGQLGLLLSLALTFSAALGVLLGWQLLARVNPLSFGWSMPIYPMAGQWWVWIGIVMALSLLLALLPAKQAHIHAVGERL